MQQTVWWDQRVYLDGRSLVFLSTATECYPYSVFIVLVSPPEVYLPLFQFNLISVC